MPKNDTEGLFIHGVQKTGTSTLLGILNTHPEIFIFYESGLYLPVLKKYGNQFLGGYPEARRFYRAVSDYSQPYLDVARYLHGLNSKFNYRYIGDKIISVDALETQSVSPNKTIYMFRDIRTWLCKEQIIRYYRSDLDMVQPAIDYTKFVINSHRFPHCYRVRTEDLIEKNDAVVAGLSDYLDLDLTVHAANWWDKVGKYEKDDPKKHILWYTGSKHSSSQLKPSRLDTTAVIKNNEFWQTCLPIFDKYYNNITSGQFTSQEIEDDLASLEDMRQFPVLPLVDCYEEVESSRLFPSHMKPRRKKFSFNLKPGKKRFSFRG